MRNPGLSAFAAPVMTEERPSTHPIWGDINDDVDPDRRLDPDEEDSDFMPHADFGRWRNPGQSIKVPVKLGPPYQPGEAPEDVIYGELLTKEDQDSADHILNGDHESQHPSANPFVEKARQDLRTPGSDVSVDTLARLLGGAHPSTMSQDAMDAAHAWLGRRFTGVRVNPHHGTLVAQSPAGTQVARRKMNLPAVLEAPEKPVSLPTYSLTNRHGTFESNDPRKIMRTMVAFQIVHNELERKKREKEQEDQDQDQNNGLATTSGLMRDLFHGGLGKQIVHNLRHGVPTFTVPEDAVFEPGHGTDRNDKGQKGGWVSSSGLPGWHHDPDSGIYYSPGHSMGEMLDPEKAKKPFPDPYHAGHTYTYAPNPETGHTIERYSGGITYFVNKLHPAARGRGFDLPRTPTPSAPAPARGPYDTGAIPISPARPASGPKKKPGPPPSAGRPRPKKTTSVQVNDLCPCCVSGYLEPYDSEFHQCLNCGSLVKHVGFEREAAVASRKPARPRGLGRGLKDIMEYEGDPLNLGTGGSENPENMPDDAPERGYVHPLADEVADPDAPVYQAPKRLLDKQSGTQEDEELDEHMGKLGFMPAHRPGDSRVYVMPDPDIEGSYYRLTEGVPTTEDGPRGWALTADHLTGNNNWFQGGKPTRHVQLERRVNDPTKPQVFRQPLPDPGDRPMSSKSILATGTHPIDDDHLNRALRDVAKNGRNSATYQNTFMDAAYEPPRLPAPGPGKTQRDLRGLSSVGNPGLTRFVN